MRHVSRTHRVALDGFFDRINLEPKIQIKYVDTKNQLADILTKGSFSGDEWNHLRHVLVAISKKKNFLFLRTESVLCLVPCRNEDRTRPRTMAHRRQKQDPLIWWCTVSAKKKSRHKVRDLWSIRWMTMEEKGSDKHQETAAVSIRTSKSDIPKWVDKRRLL